VALRRVSLDHVIAGQSSRVAPPSAGTGPIREADLITGARSVNRSTLTVEVNRRAHVPGGHTNCTARSRHSHLSWNPGAARSSPDRAVCAGARLRAE